MNNNYFLQERDVDPLPNPLLFSAGLGTGQGRVLFIFVCLCYLVDCTVYICMAGSCSVCAKTQPESKCPELLANYCDMLLRKTPLSKKLTSEEVEKKLKDVVNTVLKFIRTLCGHIMFRLTTYQKCYVLCDFTCSTQVHYTMISLSPH